MFAVETLDNGVNLVAIFFAVHGRAADSPLPNQHVHLAHLARIPQRLDPIRGNERRHRSLSFIDTPDGLRGACNRRGGGTRGTASVDDRGSSSSGRGGLSLGALRWAANVPAPASRRQIGPIKRLPPVLDMSPEMSRRYLYQARVIVFILFVFVFPFLLVFTRRMRTKQKKKKKKKTMKHLCFYRTNVCSYSSRRGWLVVV